MIIKNNSISKLIGCIVFTFLFATTSYAQQPNDCVNAVTVCGNSSFSLDVSGVGTQELTGSNTCASQENNSIWLEVSIANSGTLAFTLTPGSTDISEDYDFFIFGPNATCGNLGQAIRCSTTNPAAANQGNNLTGLNATDPDPDEGPGADGDSFVSAIDVLAGQSYFIVIDRPIGNSPFSLEWTGTATFPDNPGNPVLANPNITSLPDLDICDNLAPYDDGITEIDLTTLTQDIINGEGDVLVSYHASESDANINANPINPIFNTAMSAQRIHIRIENTTSGCFILNDLNINVSTFSNFNNPTDFELCDDDADGDDQNGLSTFNLGIKSQEIINNVANANYTISYHLSEVDAENSANPLPLIYTNTTPTPTEIFVRILDNTEGCVAFTSFNIIVAAKPLANNVSLLQCDEDGIPEGFTTFNITEAYNSITNNSTTSQITYYLSEADALNNTDAIDGNSFDNFLNPQVVYTRVTNPNTGCINFSEISLEVSTTSSNNTAIELCDTDGTEDGFMNFNLADSNTIVLAGSPAGLNLQYYETYENALLEVNPIGPNFTNTIPYNQTIYGRVENANACYGISEIELTVFELPTIEIQSEALYCLNTFPETIVLDGGVINDAPSNYFYTWSTGADTAQIEVNTPGTYTVRVTNTNGCFKDRTITVLPSNTATITTIDVVDATQNNTISIFVTGEGDYEYALDDANGPYQDSNTFQNVLPGFYTVYVRDKNNCGSVDELISVIGFPKFFTPNADGDFDTWQVKGVSSQFQPNTAILIFDRYGKLLKELDPLSNGWNGTYNGSDMPSSDYWFKVTLEDGRIFTSHFTLKR